MSKASRNRRPQAEFLAAELVKALRADVEKRGYDLHQANAYSLGYMEAMVARLAAKSPSGLDDLLSTLQMVKERA